MCVCMSVWCVWCVRGVYECVMSVCMVCTSVCMSMYVVCVVCMRGVYECVYECVCCACARAPLTR